MRQDIHIEDRVYWEAIIANWLNGNYSTVFDLMGVSQLETKVLQKEAINVICTTLTQLQTQHKDIGKGNKIQMVTDLPASSTSGKVYIKNLGVI